MDTDGKNKEKNFIMFFLLPGMCILIYACQTVQMGDKEIENT